MAEFCKECFKKVINNIPENKIKMSEDIDICENCKVINKYVIYEEI